MPCASIYNSLRSTARQFRIVWKYAALLLGAVHQAARFFTTDEKRIVVPKRSDEILIDEILRSCCNHIHI